MVTRSAFVASKTILLVNSAKSAMLFDILFSKFDSQTRLHHVDCSRSLGRICKLLSLAFAHGQSRVFLVKVMVLGSQ
ncbi:uncharacterized protein LOC131297896 [Rhododendron vialii]|uniref:uncharacterized protein LOC131297896 n=1 Tax=Rhododendron vialii TaxID=182163 RepID=UPI00265E3B94|nr:uncharacterized protein LOC131297896 [Rhododendron vialii]